MAKVKLTPEMIEDILARIPEGFIHRSVLAKRMKVDSKRDAAFEEVVAAGKVALEGDIFYDPLRLTAEHIRTYGKWFQPVFPQITADGHLPETPIVNRIKAREQQLERFDDPAFLRLIKTLEDTPGFAPLEELELSPEEDAALQTLLDAGVLKLQDDELVYDPLRVSAGTMREAAKRHRLVPLREHLTTLLISRPGETAPMTELVDKFGKETINELLSAGGFGTFTIPIKQEPFNSTWLRLKGGDLAAARKVAESAVKIKDVDWQDALDAAGDVLRPGARDGKTRRIRTIARSYTLLNAAKRLGVHENSLERAIIQGYIPAFDDPEGKTRLPAASVEEAFNDSEYYEQIAAFEVLKARDLAIVTDTGYPTMRRKLQRANVNRTSPRWGQVRGRWGLPDTLVKFHEQLRAKLAEKQAERDAERERLRAEQRAERERREELRAKLVAAFPTWQHERRSEQQIKLHIGPPNSGKTHEALNTLSEVNSGWYLAPLRLLAYEIFDRLNQRGVLCSLLTGEEYIPVPGATVTAATIEMFNPNQSGECVIIDEAQMLADPDRGWAWTRAIMEAQAPEIHIIGPATVQGLVQTLADSAAIPLTVAEHQRLTPIRVAQTNWPLQNLPPKTILVAFSRQMVLHLKTSLEQNKRTVSVVYGNLPPEVRRRQADRFANGETEICVATDAVGMGLNLPADNVCFYELQKFDGKQVRTLTPGEVQQIGGRAGRFGFSSLGEIGAITKRDLKLVHELYNAEPVILTHARVAPSVADLELIPGNLASKLTQWAALESIPESLRGSITTADMSERIELARMLTDQQVNQLGLETALKLINSPTRQHTRYFWYDCALAILRDEPMPLPPQAPAEVNSSTDLETIEACVSCADIYLWLASRREFSRFGPEEHQVRSTRAGWSMHIDIALLQKIDTARRCSRCRAPLPAGHRYSICDNCYAKRFAYYDDYEYDFK